MRKIEVFIRHCYYSKASSHKPRLKHFSHEKCYQNLMQISDPKKVNFTFFLDQHFGEDQDHFIKNQKEYPVIAIDAGCEAKSFLAMVDYVVAQDYDPETAIYFLEDDYLHIGGWEEVLLEGLSLPVDYVTLFDDRDKYEKGYEELRSKLFFTKTCHWRTTPATTNTYAMRLDTLKRDLEIHKAFSIGREITADYDKFCKLHERGATLISSLPGWSTHIEPTHLSPCTDWESYFERTNPLKRLFLNRKNTVK